MNLLRKSVLTTLMISIVGCNSNQSKDGSSDTISNKTEFALGLNKTQFTVYEVNSSMIKTTYKVKTSKGGIYNCYFTKAMGIPASDALCSKMNGMSSDPIRNSSCNALLKAAGKC